MFDEYIVIFVYQRASPALRHKFDPPAREATNIQ